MKHLLPTGTVNFIERQIILHDSKTTHRRYAVSDEMMALSIFYQSHKAYKLLSKLFALPSARTLQWSLQNTNILPGFNDSVFRALKTKIDAMNDKDRYVAVIFDEMVLKTALVYNHGLDKIEGFEDLGELGSSHFIADHALVFMVRGLLSKWKQPVGYFLTAGTVKPEVLQQLTKICLDKLTEIGIHAQVLICDQGSNNRSFLQKLEKVSVEKPFMMHNEKKVFVMYDPPHLLKNVRNNLIKSNYKYDDVDIKWEYVVDFYNTDNLMSIRMAPKLTDKHITLPPFATMRVNLAAQILSHSVAAGINTLCSLGKLPDEASATAEFIETFDQLFHAFNSARLMRSHKYKHALSDNSGHITFLESCLRFLSKIKTGENVVVPCIVGWQISIRSLIMLWQELKTVGFKYLLTNRLNQDCLENLFSIIRGKGGFRDNPDSQQFRAAFRHVVVDKLFVHSTSANCILDADKILLDISNVTILQKAGKRKKKKAPGRIETIEPLTVAMPAPSLPKSNVAAYMAGYLIKRYPVDDCTTCKQFKIASLPESSQHSYYELLQFKTYSTTDCLVYPSAAFIEFVQALEATFSCIFAGIMHLTNVLQTLCKNSEKEVQEMYKCDNTECLTRFRECVKLFMTTRIHHAIKGSNIGVVHGYKRNRKMLKLCHQ